MKSQIVANQKNREIICLCFPPPGQGKVHDFRMWKRSKIRLEKDQDFLGYQGYQGIQKLHQKSRKTQKKSKKKS
jgi:hypothetical protein